MKNRTRRMQLCGFALFGLALGIGTCLLYTSDAADE